MEREQNRTSPESWKLGFSPVTQLLLSASIRQCLGEISSWMKNSCLKPNPRKTEVMLVARGKYFEELAATVQSLIVEDLQPQLVMSVYRLAFLLNSSDTKFSHSVCEKCFLSSLGKETQFDSDR